MRQFTYTIQSNSDLMKAITEVKAHPCYAPSSAVYAEIMAGEKSADSALKICETLRTEMPGIMICGISSYLEIDKESIQKESIVLGILVFESSTVEIHMYDEDKMNYADISKEIVSVLGNTKDAACARLFVNTSYMENVRDFFLYLKLPSDKFPLSGCAVSAVEYGDKDVNHYFLTDGEITFRRGVMLAVFCGKDLHAETTYSQGWRPTGISHTITAGDGDEILEIDGKPATEFYQKYLGVDVDDHFIENIFDFPLMIQHGIYDIVRDVSALSPRGGLVIKGGFIKEDKLHLSMGIISEMLRQSFDRAKKLVKFRGQALILTVCSNRNIYMREKEKREIEFFTQIAPDLSGCFAFGEIVNVQKEVFLLNCSIVAMSMREGEPDMDEPADSDYDYADNTHIPFVDKVTHLIQATTEEYMELEEQERERELQGKIEIARAANEAKSSFLSNMSHEIRTPINSILGMDEMILRTSRSPEITKYAQDIRKAGDTLLSLINEILDFSKIEAGKMEIIPIGYSLSSMLNDLYVITEGRIADRTLELRMEVDPEIPDECIGDEIRIRQILMNLLSNAVKYTKEGTITFIASYKKVDESHIEITFKVRDTGIGIKEEDIPKLFSAFERIEEKRNRNIEGTGLGMNITKQLLQLMGSCLEVSSVYGKGSEFSCTLLQEVADWAPIGSDYIARGRERDSDNRNQREVFHAPNARILAVDDTSMNLTVIRNLLMRTKVQVDTVESGKACLEAISEAKYDMIFMDHRMPEMDGTETMKAIRALPEGSLNRETPIIVLTANAMSGMKEKFMKDGFDAYMAKPVDPKELENTVRRFLPEDKVILVESAIAEDPSGEALVDRIKDPALREVFSRLYSAPQLAVEDAVNNCGDPETYLNILIEFINNLADKMGELVLFLERDDIKNFTIKVHALKTSARLSGLPDFSNLCLRMEQAGDAGDVNFIKLHITLLVEWAAVLEESIGVLLPNTEEDTSRPEISKEQLYEGYEALMEFISVNDYESIEMIFDNLRSYRIPAEEKDKFKKIKKQMDKMDYDSVLQLLKE